MTFFCSGFVGGVIVFIALSNNNAFEFDRYMTSAVIFGSILAGRLVGQDRGKDRLGDRLTLGSGHRSCRGCSICSRHRHRGDRGTWPVVGFTQVSKFLEANHLDNGIGDYLDASIITVATDGRVTVRPVSGDREARIVRYQRQSSADWYRGQAFEFLLYDTGIPGSFDAVTASLTFGPPMRTYSIGNYRVLVWAHPISVSVNGFDPG